MKCQVQWIDCAGDPTPDDNEATQYATLNHTGKRFAVCDAHAAMIQDRRCHFGRCSHLTNTPPSWTLSPIPEEV